MTQARPRYSHPHLTGSPGETQPLAGEVLSKGKQVTAGGAADLSLLGGGGGERQQARSDQPPLGFCWEVCVPSGPCHSAACMRTDGARPSSEDAPCYPPSVGVLAGPSYRGVGWAWVGCSLRTDAARRGVSEGW